MSESLQGLAYSDWFYSCSSRIVWLIQQEPESVVIHTNRSLSQALVYWQAKSLVKGNYFEKSAAIQILQISFIRDIAAISSENDPSKKCTWNHNIVSPGLIVTCLHWRCEPPNTLRFDPIVWRITPYQRTLLTRDSVLSSVG